ncbi:MAG: hypothetical protein LBI54_05425 [Lachnospiraceae bacterium]|nr:hypothetical protein [Lachnospiraceae bacterium]
MHTKIEGNQRMHQVDAAVLYPDSYIVVRSEDMESQMSEVLYVCDTEDEAVAKILGLDDQMFCGYFEGQNLRRSLGGVVVGG